MKSYNLNCLFIAVLVSLCFYITGCSNRQVRIEGAVRNLIGKEFGADALNPDSTCDFTIIRYIDNPACTSCQLKLGQWRVFMRGLQKRSESIIRLYFFVDTDNPKEVIKMLDMYGMANNCTIDSLSGLRKRLNIDAALGKDVVLLLDSTNCVLALGNPCEDPYIEGLYNNIISHTPGSIM